MKDKKGNHKPSRSVRRAIRRTCMASRHSCFGVRSEVRPDALPTAPAADVLPAAAKPNLEE